MIVLLHGAYHGPEIWADFPQTLSEATGHAVKVADLTPGIGTFEVRVQCLAAWLQEYEGQEIILIAHSLGGLFAAEVMARWPTLVEKVIYITAYLPQPGQSVADLVREDSETQIPTIRNLAIDQNAIAIDPVGAVNVLYHDLLEDAGRSLAAKMSPQPVADFKRIMPPRPAEQTPSTYIICSADRAIGPMLQHRMAEAAKCDPIFDIASGHMPMLSVPDKLAQAITQTL